MLSLEWVHASYKGYESVGFRELIVELANAPHESLFSTELIITLVEHFWDYYYKRIFFFGFIPYMVYFVCTIVYVTTWAVDGIPTDEVWSPTPEFFLRWIVFVCVLYFLFFEIVAIVRDGWSYLTDIFNYFDWIAFFLNFYVTYTTVWDSNLVTKEEKVSNSADSTAYKTSAEKISDYEYRRAIASGLVLLMWVKTFYWMRLFTATSFYIRLISETLSDIKYFLILFIFILMTFGNTVLVMN